jgi:hypothetical protein
MYCATRRNSGRSLVSIHLQYGMSAAHGNVTAVSRKEADGEAYELVLELRYLT